VLARRRDVGPVVLIDEEDPHARPASPPRRECAGDVRGTTAAPRCW
jgi:hypothetical protein